MWSSDKEQGVKGQASLKYPPVKIQGNGSGGAVLHTKACIFSYAKVKWEEGSLVFLGVWEIPPSLLSDVNRVSS